MLKTDYPVLINGTQMDVEWLQWDVAKNNIVSSQETEAGTEDMEVIRTGKVSISALVQVSDRWAHIIDGFNDIPVLPVKYYDVSALNYVEKSMYMSDLSIELAQYSNRQTLSNGLYTVSFKLTEF